jgi:hypothetical protein
MGNMNLFGRAAPCDPVRPTQTREPRRHPQRRAPQRQTRAEPSRLGERTPIVFPTGFTDDTLKHLADAGVEARTKIGDAIVWVVAKPTGRPRREITWKAMRVLCDLRAAGFSIDEFRTR